MQTTTQTPSSIDMFTPAQTCERLRLNEVAVLGLVNAGALPAYDLAGSIRFKVTDVLAVTRALTAA